MRLRHSVTGAASALALALAAGLAGCSSGPEAAAATDAAGVMSQVEKKASGALASEAAYEALFAALPGGMTATVGGYDAKGQGVVARDVVLTGENGIGLKAARFMAYDLDQAALSGALGEAGGKVAGRIEAEGVEITGLADLVEGVTGEMTDAMPEMGGSIEQTVDRYTIKAARLVADGVTLYPQPESPLEDDDLLAGLADYAAMSLGYGADAIAMMDAEIDFAMTQKTASLGEMGEGEAFVMTTDSAGTFKIARSGVSGYDRGDMAFAFAEDMSGSFTSDSGDGMPEMVMDFTAARTTQEGIKLADALGFLMAGELPPSSMTDLMSLGLTKAEDMAITLNGEPYYSIDSYELDLAEWHGLMPERIAYAERSTFYASGFMKLMNDAMESAAPEGDQDAQKAKAQMAALTTILRDAALDEVAMANDFTYDWSPETGETTIRADGVYAELGRFGFEMDGALPAYAQFAAIDASTLGEAPEGQPGPLAALMSEDAEFGRMKIVLGDEGGIDRVLTALIAFAELEQNDGDQQMAILRGQTPEGLRAMGSGGLAMASAQLAAIAPEAQDMATRVSTWVREGGTLTIEMNPATPIGMGDMDALMAMPEGPAGLIQTLGLEVTHDAP